MINLKPCQNDAVTTLYLYFCALKNKDAINFQAPTGSGKTLILSALCNEIIRGDEKVIILFASISTGDIHEQNYEKATNYKLENGYDYLTYLINSPSSSNINKNQDIDINIPLINKTIYFMGIDSYKKKAILKERCILESFFQDAKNHGYKLVYIRDEAHIATGSEKSNFTDFEKLINKYFNARIYVSATLNEKKIPDVEITLDEAIRDGLIKSHMHPWASILEEDNNTISNKENNIDAAELLDKAINHFKIIKHKYQKYNINPAMLIQISSVSEKQKQLEINEQLEMIKQKLNSAGLKYVIWTSDTKLVTNANNYIESKNKITKKDKQLITKNDSPIDVIIFKVALATGWDIPRACMLVQLREIHSKTLDIQTIGRIRRNPLHEPLKDDDILNNYYIYSNYSKEFKGDYLIYNLNQKYKNKAFKTVSIINDLQKYQSFNNYDDFKNQLFQMLEKENFVENNYQNYLRNRSSITNNQTSYVIKYDDIDEYKNLTSYKISNVFDVYKIFNYALPNEIKFKEYIYNFIFMYSKMHDLNPYIVMLCLLDKDNKYIFQLFKDAFNDHGIKDEKYVLNKELAIFNNSATEMVNNDNPYIIYNMDEYEHLIYILNKNKGSLKNRIGHKYFFDSAPEQIFANEIQQLINKDKENKYGIILGRNYLDNSKIKYEYKYEDDGIYKKANSFPDFLVLVNNDVYVIEIKSATLDYNKTKTNNLKIAYKEHSKLTGYYHIVLSVNRTNNGNETFNWISFKNGKVDSELNDVPKNQLYKLFHL